MFSYHSRDVKTTESASKYSEKNMKIGCIAAYTCKLQARQHVYGYMHKRARGSSKRKIHEWKKRGRKVCRSLASVDSCTGR